MIASENDTQRRVSSGDSRTLEELNIDDPKSRISGILLSAQGFELPEVFVFRKKTMLTPLI